MNKRELDIGFVIVIGFAIVAFTVLVFVLYDASIVPPNYKDKTAVCTKDGYHLVIGNVKSYEDRRGDYRIETYDKDVFLLNESFSCEIMVGGSSE